MSIWHYDVTFDPDRLIAGGEAGKNRTALRVKGKVQDRMPVIPHQRDDDRSLERGETHRPPVDLLRPYEAEEMQSAPCNLQVGNVRNNGPETLNCA